MRTGFDHMRALLCGTAQHQIPEDIGGMVLTVPEAAQLEQRTKFNSGHFCFKNGDL